MALGANKPTAAAAAVSKVAAATGAARNNGVRSVNANSAKALSSFTDNLAKGDIDKPLSAKDAGDFAKALGVPEAAQAFAQLTSTPTEAAEKAVDKQIASTTAQSKAAGFDTGFGLYGSKSQNNNQSINNNSNDWIDTGADTALS